MAGAPEASERQVAERSVLAQRLSQRLGFEGGADEREPGEIEDAQRRVAADEGRERGERRRQSVGAVGGVVRYRCFRLPEEDVGGEGKGSEREKRMTKARCCSEGGANG